MNLLIKNIGIITALCFCLPATAQEHHDHENHAAHDMHEHHGGILARRAEYPHRVYRQLVRECVDERRDAA